MFFAFPHTRARFQYAHIRFFEREFGLEYTKFENRRMQEVYQAKTHKLSEVSGYVVWLRRNKAFLIVPTLTSPEPSVFCEIPDWINLEIPPDRAFVVTKGKWGYKVARGVEPSASPIFTVDHYKVTRPDLGSIRPDSTYHDFREILFEGLADVYPEVQDLVAHSIISSPKTLDRLGGLTLSVYNESKATSRVLLAYLKRFLPKEFLRQQALPSFSRADRSQHKA
ncbi:hypothetical protein Ngar_c04700 [Candidatus Nitrososphaera gargensis Ga9.2]|uniref:Uncharacterized protein n=1 Tax=Nitrososphaera gargensis (strain Ga9.2) TaxID=1237085 RepID=K0ILX1_NITGG|nr:hypothetical protein [Candidatus Nitrososphaera gargensis]AFU57414.1 hypothetical protein Ngar_c04700 [Candidatus Nitrososphaera gargensis Ga9.2]